MCAFIGYANTSCNKLGIISKSARVNIIDKYIQDWYSVNYDGSIGYVSAFYVNLPTNNENIKGAVNRLEDCGCIASAQYWLNNYTDIKYLDRLILNMGLAVKSNAAKKNVQDFNKALEVLSIQGIVSTKEYWQANVNKVKYLKDLIISAANAGFVNKR